MSANSNLQNCCGDGRGWRRGEPVPLSITARPVRARGGWTRGAECRLHVLEAGWQERHGGVPGSERGAEWGEGERGRKREGGTGECVCSRLCVFRDVCVFIFCLSVRTRVLATMSAFACMSMRMSTHSWGQTLTHKWNLATWVPGSLSWARTAADLASLSGAVSTRQDSKRRAWRGRKGRGEERMGRGRGRGLVTSREPLPKSGLLSRGREAPCWHTASAEKLESSIARSAAVLGQDNERKKGKDRPINWAGKTTSSLLKLPSPL